MKGDRVAAMDASHRGNLWARGDAYESYIGRWSRKVAHVFIPWLGAPPGQSWLDVGCGTGALSEAILDLARPAGVVGIDPSPGFIDLARRRLPGPPTRFARGAAQRLPVKGDTFDTVVSGLMLNFVPVPAEAVAEMARAARPGGTVATYVWDYDGEMQMMRIFWNTAVALDPQARQLSEGPRFLLCRPEPLASVFESAGLREVAVRAIDVPTVFRDFDDFWRPFLGRQGPAPAYVATLTDAARSALGDRLQATLPVANDGSIHLIARAWAVRGVR